MYLLPQESEGSQNKKIKIFSVVIAGIIALISIIIGPIVIKNFFPNYYESIIPMQILSIGIIPFTILYIQEAQFLGKEKSRAVLITTSLSLVSYFTLIVILGKEFGLIGIAIAFLISLTIRVFLNWIIALRSS
jgi:O-antigen/teichoic acid export membrane protein